MTFERWLIVALTCGFILDRLLIRVQHYFTEQNRKERLRCEEAEHRRIFYAGWNAAIRCMEADERNYRPKEAKAGEK